MNIFEKLLSGKPSAFEVALGRRGGAGGLDATLRKLKEAEVVAIENLARSVDSTERASMQHYIEAIACARIELERFNLAM
ncbi:hypothetical protein [Burkholderia pyrrocinia]